uniref:GTPase RsgA n=1 Tax=Lactococcus garvieae TaxID=1363 RepID=UPI0023EB13A8
GMKPIVGDFVDFSAEENSEGYILDIHKRRNSLIRPSIANIDQVNPDFSLNLLDRFLVFLEHKDIQPLIYISKLDLLEDRSEYDQ